VPDQLAVEDRLALLADLGVDQLAQRLRSRPSECVVDRLDPGIGASRVGVAIDLIRHDILGVRAGACADEHGHHSNSSDLHVASRLANRCSDCPFSPARALAFARDVRDARRDGSAGPHGATAGGPARRYLPVTR